MNDVAKLKELIVLTASYYNQVIRPEVLQMYVEDLADLNPNDLVLAYTKYRRDPKNRTFPLPAQIRAIVHPEIDPDSIAKEISARISGAIPKYGWDRSIDAQEYIGPIGWKVVKKLGGWSYLCQNHGVTINPTTFMAQTRELIKTEIQFPSVVMDESIGLGSSKKRDLVELTSARDLIEASLSRIPSKRKEVP